MANDQASYRTLIDEILGTAVDTSTWTTTIKDDGLRHALKEFDRLTVYETSFTVVTTGEEQDLSGITSVDNILAAAYPWTDGASFKDRQQYFRITDDQTLYFEDYEPIADQVIRVRYTIQHAIKDLDSAAATTVPTRHERTIGLLAAAQCCVVRYRQISENPAIPRDALLALRVTASQLSDEARELITTLRPSTSPRWSDVGL